MCTLSFLPDDDGGYLLGLNRDELPSRSTALPPRLDEAAGVPMCTPIDPDGGGSWIALNARGYGVCLINGDSQRLRAPTVGAPSRGLLVTSVILDPAPDAVSEFFARRQREGQMLENPFRLYVAEPGARGRAPKRATLHRFEWTGLQMQRTECAESRVEISNGYDQSAVTQRRSASFHRWLGDGGSPDLDPLVRWHCSHDVEAPDGDVFSQCMHHTVASTVSATFLEVREGCANMHYRNGQPCQSDALTATRLPTVRGE